MPKNGKHTRRPSVRNQMSHAEIMDKRYQKRKKKEKTYEGFVGSRHYHLKEYMKLTDNEEVSKKSIARSIMDIVEEINDEGMNNKRYLDIMDQLMSLHNEGENSRKDYLINSERWEDTAGPVVVGEATYIDGNSLGTGSIGQFGFGSHWISSRIILTSEIPSGQTN
jgi:hypothetical protein